MDSLENVVKTFKYPQLLNADFRRRAILATAPLTLVAEAQHERGVPMQAYERCGLEDPHDPHPLAGSFSGCSIRRLAETQKRRRCTVATKAEDSRCNNSVGHIRLLVGENQRSKAARPAAVLTN